MTPVTKRFFECSLPKNSNYQPGTGRLRQVIIKEGEDSHGLLLIIPALDIAIRLTIV